MTVEVKICGLRTPETLAAALDARADYVGLVLFPPSPRNVALEAAARLAELARGRSRIVALSVDAPDELIAAIQAIVKPDIHQLHGSESPERVAAVKALTGARVMKAIKVASRTDAELALAYREAADLILYDAKPPNGADRPGGHGAVFDWSALDSVKDTLPFMLSGGLTAENVAAAVGATGARAVDVSSGVETSPGAKSSELIRRFVAAAKAAPDAR